MTNLNLIDQESGDPKPLRLVLNTDGSYDLSVDIRQDDEYIGQVGKTLVRRVATFARQLDNPIYAVNDAISTSSGIGTTMAFIIGRAEGYGVNIVKAGILTDFPSCTPRLRLYIYNAQPNAIADNAQFPLLWADRAKYEGKIDFPALAQDGTGSTAAGTYVTQTEGDIPMPAITGPSGVLYAMMTTLDAFVPASGQNFYVILEAEQY